MLKQTIPDGHIILTLTPPEYTALLTLVRGHVEKCGLSYTDNVTTNIYYALMGR